MSDETEGFEAGLGAALQDLMDSKESYNHWSAADYLCFIVEILHGGEVEITREDFEEHIAGKALAVDATFREDGATIRTVDLTDATPEEQDRPAFQEHCDHSDLGVPQTVEGVASLRDES